MKPPAGLINVIRAVISALYSLSISEMFDVKAWEPF